MRSYIHAGCLFLSVGICKMVFPEEEEASSGFYPCIGSGNARGCDCAFYRWEKPWHDKSVHPYKKEYLKYLDLTQWSGERPPVNYMFRFTKLFDSIQGVFGWKNVYRKFNLYEGYADCFNLQQAGCLVLCLESIFRQTVLPGEIIIGDDGSKQETVDVIREYQKKSPVPLIHIWQEDNGFQLAKARNKCIARACYEYIVQVDGDLVLHEHFIEDHLLFAERGYYVKGGGSI